MPHGLHGYAFTVLRPGQKQQPVKLRLLPGKAYILHSEPEEGYLGPQSRVRVAVILAHRGGIDRAPDVVH